MKKSMATAALVLAAGQACGQWSDDFNRASLGPLWIGAGGTLGHFSIVGNRGAHASGLQDAMGYGPAAGPYQLSTQTIDLFANPGNAQLVALGSGYGAGNNLYLKLQVNGGSQYDSIGFYSGLGNSSGWPGASPTFVGLAAPFDSGRMQVYFTGGGDTANVVIDTNFDGIPDQSYSRSGVRAFMAGSGTGFGIGSGGPASFDNWRIMPAIFPPASSNGLFLAPFGANSTDTVHQVFRSDLWQTPVRITGVRYAPTSTGSWTGNVSIAFGYTSRVPGVVAPAGLDIPTAGGFPNAMGPLFPYYSNAAFAQTLVAGVAPIAEDFQLAFNSTPGFVYFPGMGNLLMETRSVVGGTLDLAVSRAANGPDSSVAYETTRFGNGSGVAVNATPLVQLVAMPCTPEVLPTWGHAAENLLPFASGAGVNHQVHHAATIAPMGAGGSGKVAIQGLKYAPLNGTLGGQVTVRMGYSSRVPGVAGPAGLELPAAGGGGAPNASGPMRQFMDRTMNLEFPGAGTENFQLDLHQTPFVYDPSGGNLLIETQTDLTLPISVSRATGSLEASRAFRSPVFGNLVDPTRASRIKFAATPVSEDVLPKYNQNGGINLPFFQGTHVVDQVFSASMFGAEPVRIDSIAYAAFSAGSITADVTVRMGYTSREPGQVPPLGLSVPDMNNEGFPNASIRPMAVFRSGAFSANVAAGDPNSYPIVLKGDAPFLYNPAMGNLLVEVVVTANGPLPVYAKLDADGGSSMAINSTYFGPQALLTYAPMVKFTYFKDLYPCVADMNGDGAVDLLDFFAFFNCWDVSGQCADLDGNPGVDLGDFFGFFNSFDVGC